MIFAAALAGCGGGGGGGGSASTVTGNVSNGSMAMRQASPPTMLARVLRFLSPVTDAFAGRNGIRVTINGSAVETDPNGFFTVSGPFSGMVTVEFGSGNRTFTLEVDVPEGGTIVLRDVDLRDDGKAHPAKTEFRFRGTIASVSCNTAPKTLAVDVAGQNVTVDLDDSTRIQISGQGDSNRTCSDLAGQVGQRVKVEGERQNDGTLLADRVKVNPENEAEDRDREVEFEGTVTALNCPSSITVQRTDGESVTVNLSSSTEFEGATGCSDLASKMVEVEGDAQNGSVAAKKIEVEGES